MENKIIHTIKNWLPWAIEADASISEYGLLRKLADYCRQHIQKQEYEKVMQVVRIINLLYSSGSLHERNAIENEFLEVLSTDEAPASLKEHMKVLPEKLKSAYIKTIIEN